MTLTTGEILFYSGAGLLGLTVLLTIIFIIVKPKYEPENGAYDSGDPGRTQRLRSGYTTDQINTGRPAPRPQVPAASMEETELLPRDSTALIPGQDYEENIWMK